MLSLVHPFARVVFDRASGPSWQLSAPSYAPAEPTSVFGSGVLRVPLAGVAPDDVEVRLVGRELRVGVRRDGRVVVVRRVGVPAAVDRDAVRASMEHGLLTVELPTSAGYDRLVPLGSLAVREPVAGALDTGDADPEEGVSDGNEVASAAT